MRHELFKQIDNIAKDLMSDWGYKDFSKYERKSMRKIKSRDYPFIIQFGSGHCYLMNPKRYGKSYGQDEVVRYSYAQSFPFSFNFSENYCKEDRYFLVEKTGVSELTATQAKFAIKDLMTPLIARYQAKHEPMPKRFKVAIKFPNLKLSKLKELLKRDESQDNGSLLKTLKGFRHYTQYTKDHCIKIFYDYGCNEFGFGIYMHDKCTSDGGIVYHGNPNVGYQQNGSVQFQPNYGWQIHT